jgi:hypothetical protein
LVNKLPEGPKWKYETITVRGGDKVDANGASPAPEVVDLWLRDPIECAAILLGSPAFKDACKYASEHIMETGKNGMKHHVYSEMWSGEWWKSIEVCWLFCGEDVS